jgi:nitroreductase
VTSLPPPPPFGAPLPQGRSDETLAFLACRRSTSAVTLGEPAPTGEQLDDLLRLAARVPDHGKLSPWRFLVIDTAAKAALVARLEALARGRGDDKAIAKLAKLRIPPLAVFVISSPRAGEIPEWEQLLSAGAVCATLLYAALASGFGANWITDWYSYDPDATAILGLEERERVAGCILIGTPREPPLERERPVVGSLVSRWEG